MKVLLFALLLIFFSGCSYKDIDKKIFKEKIEFEKPKNNQLFLEVIKSSDSNTSFSFDISSLENQLTMHLEKKGIEVLKEDNNSSILKLDLVIENISTKKTLANSIINNSDIRISIGKVFGNFGISGTVGTKVGNILNDDSTYEEYQGIFDVFYSLKKDNNQSTQVEVVSAIDDKNSSITNQEIEKEVANSIIKLFK